MNTTSSTPICPDCGRNCSHIALVDVVHTFEPVNGHLVETTWHKDCFIAQALARVGAECDQLCADLARVEVERDQLRAEVKRLQDEIDSRQKWASAWKRIARTYREHANSLSTSLINLRRRRVTVAPDLAKVEAERDRATAEIDRLRSALQDIANTSVGRTPPSRLLVGVIEAANRALLSTTAVKSHKKAKTGDKAG